MYFIKIVGGRVRSLEKVGTAPPPTFPPHYTPVFLRSLRESVDTLEGAATGYGPKKLWWLGRSEFRPPPPKKKT